QAFLPALGDRGHDPFFSLENATTWITSRGYQLYLEHDDAQTSLSLWNPDQATPSQLRAYRSFMIGDAYIDHSFFSLDNTDSWINLVAFHTYMNIFHGSFDDYRTYNSTPFSSCAPSRTGSSMGSRALSRADSSFSRGESRPSSRASFLPALCAPSSRSSSPFGNDVIEISSDSDDDLSAALPAPPLVPKIEDTAPSALQSHRTAVSLNAPARQRKGKQKAEEGKIQITRQESVDRIVEISTIPSTWPVPRTPTAYLIDLSNSLHLLKRGNKTSTIDRFIREEVQDSWGKPGSNGHTAGDADAAGFFPDLTETIRCRRCQLTCSGVYTCEFIDENPFADCQRYEPDEAAMRELWKHELDANEREAASIPGLISRFYSQIMQFKCKSECNGTPILKRLSSETAYGKSLFVGCSKWTRTERFEHRYLPIPNNVDEAQLQFAISNGGRLSTVQTVNDKCALTVHPRIGAGLNGCRTCGPLCFRTKSM
ncbi:hypothetical protein B0H14DRAFT_2361002, partial [Mycena olivaceomarginata]